MSDDREAIDALILQGESPHGLERTLRSLPPRVRALVLAPPADSLHDTLARHHALRIEPAAIEGRAGESLAAMAGLEAEWVLLLNAGECLDPPLAGWLEHAPLADAEQWRLAVRTLFLGKVMRFGGSTQRQVRLVRRREAQLRHGDGGMELAGEGRCAGAPGSVLRVRDEPLEVQLERAIASSAFLRNAGPPERRRPLEATRLFLDRYVRRLGLLDGRAGFHLAVIEAHQRYMRRMLDEEAHGRASGRTRPAETDPAVSQRRRHPVSVLVLTRDEERNIGQCLSRLTFSDDIVVYDSLSVDRTVEIARSFENVTVVERQFDNWSSHQNWGVENIRFKHPWVLYIDADERVEAELAQELQRLADPASPHAAFRMRRKDMFMGRWIKHATLYPTWLVRMFRPERIRYERLVNPVAVVDGSIGSLDQHLIHYPFSKGVYHWIERHNNYSSFEAEETMKILKGQRRPFGQFFSRDPNERRAAMKDFFYRLPLRPQIKWLYYMFVRLSFLDGKPGLIYARLQAMYEHMIVIKTRELMRKDRGGEI